MKPAANFADKELLWELCEGCWTHDSHQRMLVEEAVGRLALHLVDAEPHSVAIAYVAIDNEESVMSRMISFPAEAWTALEDFPRYVMT